LPENNELKMALKFGYQPADSIRCDLTPKA
jgi:hypothetical protein